MQSRCAAALGQLTAHLRFPDLLALQKPCCRPVILLQDCQQQMAGIGFFSGSAGPSRDLLVRRAATARFGKSAFGRIYGFVYSGLDLGLATAPLIFGGLMDAQAYSQVLIGIACLQFLAIFTALYVGKNVA